jgi:hypothetical protein
MTSIKLETTFLNAQIHHSFIKPIISFTKPLNFIKINYSKATQSNSPLQVNPTFILSKSKYPLSKSNN